MPQVKGRVKRKRIRAAGGWVSVGIDHDSAEFAVERIRCWGREMGLPADPASRSLLITANCRVRKGNRVRLWCRELQKLAGELGLTIQCVLFPPGTSKWEKIENRIFCRITATWLGCLLLSRQVVVNRIDNTKNRNGLNIKVAIDENS